MGYGTAVLALIFIVALVLDERTFGRLLRLAPYLRRMMNKKLKNNRAIAMLEAAEAGKYAVPAVCVYNLEGVHAVFRAAQTKCSPAMILLFPSSLPPHSQLVSAAYSACAASSVPLTLHLDHAQTPGQVRMAADTGMFDSIMVDMSRYSKDENLRLTRDLVAYCNKRGVATEAEPGRIEGGEDGLKDTTDLEGMLTNVTEAKRFVDTGISWLAPAFGNVHGKYGSAGIQLDYDRLQKLQEEISSNTGVRLVLHGTDGFGKVEYEKCIQTGIRKVNVNREVNEAWMNVIHSKKDSGVPLSVLMEDGTKAMQNVVETLMDWCGSSGKA